MFVQLKTVHIFQQSRQRGRNCAVTEVQVQLPRQWWQSLVPVLLPSGQSRLPGSSLYRVYKETFCNSKWNQRNVSISTRISFWTPTSCPEATLHCMFISIIYNINNYSNFIAFQATKQSWISSGRGVERNSYIWISLLNTQIKMWVGGEVRGWRLAGDNECTGSFSKDFFS